MNLTYQWPSPGWLADLPDEERRQASTRYHLALAAVFAGDRGNMSVLARKIGVHGKTLYAAMASGQVSPDLAIRLEVCLGREHFPRELFRPDLFLVKA